MEARTSVVCMHLDDLGIGVKSHSNTAMAGSCRNMPKYSLILFVCEVKYGQRSQSLLATELSPTQNLHTALNKNRRQCVRCCRETRKREPVVKVPKFVLSVIKGSLEPKTVRM